MNVDIVNGRIVDPASGHDAPAGCTSPTAASRHRPRPGRFSRRSHARRARAVVAPGLVDLCARLREPGSEGALKVEMRAALAGGVTGVVCPPDTDPPLDEPGLVRMLRQRSRESAGARTYPLGALTVQLKGEVLAEIQTLAETGCVAFMQTRSLPHDNGMLLQAMRYARTFDLPLWLRPVEDTLAGSGVAAAGPVAGRLGLPSIPVVAETVALHTIFELQRATGARVHVCRLSSAAGVELVRQAKTRGPAGDGGCRHPPCAPDRRRHRLLRSELPARSAAAFAARPRRPSSPDWPTGPSMRSAPTMRRSASRRSCCRSARPSPVRRPSRPCCR